MSSQNQSGVRLTVALLLLSTISSVVVNYATSGDVWQWWAVLAVVVSLSIALIVLDARRSHRLTRAPEGEPTGLQRPSDFESSRRSDRRSLGWLAAIPPIVFVSALIWTFGPGLLSGVQVAAKGVQDWLENYDPFATPEQKVLNIDPPITAEAVGGDLVVTVHRVVISGDRAEVDLALSNTTRQPLDFFSPFYHRLAASDVTGKSYVVGTPEWPEVLPPKTTLNARIYISEADLTQPSVRFSMNGSYVLHLDLPLR